MGLIALVVVMAIVVPAEPLRIDLLWSDAMRGIESTALKDLALVFNALGRAISWALTVATVGVMLAVARRWLALASFSVAEGLTSLSSAVLKAWVDRARPPDGLVHPLSSSFPSGHAAYAGATCVALVLLFTTPGQRRGWWVLAAAGIVGMAWSRTYLHVHWLSDVIAGALLGIAISFRVFASAQWRVTTADGSPVREDFS